jgi:hypothetical protein
MHNHLSLAHHSRAALPLSIRPVYSILHNSHPALHCKPVPFGAKKRKRSTSHHAVPKADLDSKAQKGESVIKCIKALCDKTNASK